jgi:hypothetical protein
MFVHHIHKRQTLTVEECIQIVYVLLSSILYTFVFVFQYYINCIPLCFVFWMTTRTRNILSHTFVVLWWNVSATEPWGTRIFFRSRQFQLTQVLKFGKPFCYSFFINITTFTTDSIKHNLMCLFETNHTLLHFHITPTQSHSVFISILPYFLFYSATGFLFLT